MADQTTFPWDTGVSRSAAQMLNKIRAECTENERKNAKTQNEQEKLEKELQKGSSHRSQEPQGRAHEGRLANLRGQCPASDR